MKYNRTKSLLAAVLAAILIAQSATPLVFAESVHTDAPTWVITRFENLEKTEYVIPLNADGEAEDTILSLPDTVTATVRAGGGQAQESGSVFVDGAEDSAGDGVKVAWDSSENLERQGELPPGEVREQEQPVEAVSPEMSQEEKTVMIAVIWETEGEFSAGQQGSYTYKARPVDTAYILGDGVAAPAILVRVEAAEAKEDVPVTEDLASPETGNATSALEDLASPETQISVSVEARSVASGTRMTELDALLPLLQSPNRDEVNKGSVKLNKIKLELVVGETFQLELTGAVEDEAEWFAYSRYPHEELYRAGDPKLQAEGVLNLTEAAEVTAPKPGNMEVWARYRGGLYQCEVAVLTEEETKRREMEQELDAARAVCRHRGGHRGALQHRKRHGVQGWKRGVDSDFCGWGHRAHGTCHR